MEFLNFVALCVTRFDDTVLPYGCYTG
jgi:hypothetical protein